MLGCSLQAVAFHDPDVFVAGAVESLAGMQGDAGVDVDGGDLAIGADEFGQEGGVVAGAGADLQDVVAGLWVELGEHHRDGGRHGGAGQGERAVGVVLDGDGPVGVGVGRGETRQVEVTADDAHGLLNRGWQRALGNDLVHESVAQVVEGGGAVHHGSFS